MHCTEAGLCQRGGASHSVVLPLMSVGTAHTQATACSSIIQRRLFALTQLLAKRNVDGIEHIQLQQIVSLSAGYNRVAAWLHVDWTTCNRPVRDG